MYAEGMVAVWNDSSSDQAMKKKQRKKYNIEIKICETKQYKLNNKRITKKKKTKKEKKKTKRKDDFPDLEVRPGDSIVQLNDVSGATIAALITATIILLLTIVALITIRIMTNITLITMIIMIVLITIRMTTIRNTSTHTDDNSSNNNNHDDR